MESPENKKTVESLSHWEEVVQKLQEYTKQGYLLHGSKRRLSRIEPRKARDVSGEKHKNMEGVYATNHSLIAIAVALLNQPEDTTSYWNYYGNDDGEGGERIEIGGDEGVVLSSGFIHVLPSDTFERYEGDKDTEIVSVEPVVPIKCFDVDPDILDVLPNVKTDLLTQK